VIRTSLSRSRSPGRFTHSGVYTSGSCSGERWKLFTVGTCCYVAVCRRGGRFGGARRFGAHRERRGAGHIVAAARLQLVVFIIIIITKVQIIVTLHKKLRGALYVIE